MVKGLPDATRVVFDDGRAVASAGVLLPAVLADRLGIEALIDRTVDLGQRPGGANPGRKVMTLLSAMMLGADCIDDCELLRSGQTSQVLGHRVAAPSTLGTFLRAFTFGHLRQLDKKAHLTQAHAPPRPTANAAPGLGLPNGPRADALNKTPEARRLRLAPPRPPELAPPLSPPSIQPASYLTGTLTVDRG
ncbi:MAG: hypothetical protein ACR2ND_15905 [Solirubrobacteraceae bacterium]